MYEELDVRKGLPNNYPTPAAYQQGILFYKCGFIYSLTKVLILVLKQDFFYFRKHKLK